MSAELRIGELIERKEREFMLAKSRVRMRSSIENIDAGDYRIEKLSEGQLVELPRWVADELVDLKLAESQEESFEVEVARALSKEKMMGPLQLSTLPPDFYMRMRRKLSGMTNGGNGQVKKEDFDRMRNACYDIIGMRLSKLLALSSSSTSSESLADRLAPEEEAFFSISQTLSKDWRAALLGGPS